MTGSFSLRTALLAAGLGLLAMATPAVQAAGPQRVTRDGQLKFSPVFIDGGRKLVFSAHNQPKRVSIIQLDLATRKQSLHYPIGSDSQFDIAFSRDRKVECFARSGGPRQLSLVIRNRVTNKDVVFDPPGAQRSTVRHLRLLDPRLVPARAGRGTFAAGGGVIRVQVDHGIVFIAANADVGPGLCLEVAGIEPREMSEIFVEWNRGVLDSYLIEITGDILAQVDDETGKPMVDVILDTAGQKGTGKWTGIEALQLGSPTATITEAVFARCISALKEERAAAAGQLAGVEGAQRVDRDAFIEDVRQSLYASKICSYAQGFQLLKMAAAEHDWDLNFGSIALMWRGGCIIRAQFLGDIKAAFDADPALTNLLLAPYFADAMARRQAAWRRALSAAGSEPVCP